jgi:hypothetical protein
LGYSVRQESTSSIAEKKNLPFYIGYEGRRVPAWRPSILAGFVDNITLDKYG